MQIYNMTAEQLSGLLKNKELSSLEVVNAHLERIEAVEPKTHAFLTVTAENARAQAKTIDQDRIDGKELPLLAGIPLAIKDNICTKGVKTTCASKMLENFVPPYNATVVESAEEHGLISLGKTNMDEFAMGSSSENSSFQITKNPWNLEYVAGGSSGGSAAAVAALEAPLALGTDTGGSIRQPASFCGIVGLKPTYGAISRYGVTAFASSLDQVGVLARNITDTALLFDALKGHDPKDMTSSKKELPASTSLFENGVKGLTIGVPKEFFIQSLDAEVKESVKQVMNTLEAEGATIKEVSLPSTAYGLTAYYIISSAEASSNLARFDGVRYGFRGSDITDVDDLFNKTRTQGFGPEVKRRLLLGNFVLGEENYDSYYRQAMALKKRIQKEYTDVFTQCDVLLSPVSPTTAFPIGENDHDIISAHQADTCTVTANLAGLPALSFPSGLSSKGLPMGAQVMGPHFSEAQLLNVAYTYERAVGGFHPMPELKGDA